MHEDMNDVKGNVRSNVAICTLWTPAKDIAKKLDKKTFQFAANFYSGGGINALLRTILAQPTIRYVVLTGAEINNSGDVLMQFFAKGVRKGKVTGTHIYIEKEIPVKDVERVRKHVQLIDMRGAQAHELKEKVESLHRKKKKAFGAAKQFPESEKVAENLSSEQSGFVVQEETVAEAWLEVLDKMMKFGVDKKSEHGKQIELLNVTAVMRKRGDVEEWMSCDPLEVEKYLRSFFSQKKHKDLAYTYGERLFKKKAVLGKSQIKAVVDKLKKTSYSRRAVAGVWEVHDLKKDHPPCLTHIFWNIQDNVLYQTVHFRSQEAFKAWPMNVYALRALQMQVAIALRVQVGPLTCTAHSLHLYTRDCRKAEQTLSQRKVRYAVKEYDPRGVFRIDVKRKKMIVTHMTIDGQKTGYRFEGKDVEKLLAEIHHANLISQMDHAAYLGAELQKAQDAIMFKKKYVQDEAL